MLQKIEYAEGSDELEAQYGGYNEAFPNMKEISAGEFARSIFFTYSPQHMGFRQIVPESLSKIGIEPPTNGHQPCIMSVHYFLFHDGTGIAMYSDWWGEKVRYFQFA